MLNVNRAEVIGNLTRDPEIRYIPSGQPVCNFGVATNRRYQNKAGEWQDLPVEFHNIVVWGKLAEGCSKVLKKGNRVYLCGRIQTRQWEGQDGQKRQKTEIVADTIVGPDQIQKAGGGADFESNVEEVASPVNQTESQEEPQKTEKPDEKTSSPTKAKSTDDEIDLDNIPF